MTTRGRWSTLIKTSDIFKKGISPRMVTFLSGNSTPPGANAKTHYINKVLHRSRMERDGNLHLISPTLVFRVGHSPLSLTPTPRPQPPKIWVFQRAIFLCIVFVFSSTGASTLCFKRGVKYFRGILILKSSILIEYFRGILILKPWIAPVGGFRRASRCVPASKAHW